jgi:hypothetical protein
LTQSGTLSEVDGLPNRCCITWTAPIAGSTLSGAALDAGGGSPAVLVAVTSVDLIDGRLKDIANPPE